MAGTIERGTETRTRGRVGRTDLRHMAADVAAVSFGIAFPVVFFLLSAAHAIKEDSAFTIAEWTGVGLLGFYGFAGARLAGEPALSAVLRGLAAALIGVICIALKAVLAH